MGHPVRSVPDKPFPGKLVVRGGIVATSFLPFRFNFTLRGASFRLEGWKLRPRTDGGEDGAGATAGGRRKSRPFQANKVFCIESPFCQLKVEERALVRK